MKLDFSAYREALRRSDPVKSIGEVQKVIGLVIEASGPTVSLGELAQVRMSSNGRNLVAEAVGFRDDKVLFMPLGMADGIKMGDRIEALRTRPEVGVGREMLGRVVDALGRPIDGRGHFRCEAMYPIHRDASNPMQRRTISEPLATGVRTIDALLTCGKGQRIGIFSGSGVGKSTMLGMIARNTSAEVNVLALVGERGREVKEFIENDLGEEGLAHSVVVVSTSDMPPLLRIKAAFTANAVAEFFADQGKDVLLMMDSVTRFAMAQREVGLSVGEPPSSKGYTPSVFTLMPQLYERAGAFSGKGTITGFYTVLVEGDDLADPIADHSRAILDGHIILSRELATRNHYPAIDVLQSISRLMKVVATGDHNVAAGNFRDLLATFVRAEDMINIGAYKRGANPKIDAAIDKIDSFNTFMRQEVEDRCGLEEAVARLIKIAGASAVK
jgi:flagellum-specific ATP synthase